ncbi:hypothetical protein B0H13DRAFT_1868216 [Mycena leptocephala]|nr:hypothetical protein B0H13DRAFT_1868216 [Mycena leptocephala]
MDQSEEEQQCVEEISRIFCHWERYGHHFPTATRLETRAPVPFDHPWCESISEDSQLVNDNEVAATTSYPTNDPSHFLDLFLTDLYDKDAFIEDDFAETRSPAPAEFTALDYETSHLEAPSEPISLDLLQYISPYRTVTLQTYQGITFATEYKRPPVQANVEVRMMPWGVMYYTLTTSLRAPLRTGDTMTLRGMLVGFWEVEDSLCVREGYAFVQMKNQRHYLVALIAVSQEMANLAAPLGNEEERHKVLLADWDIRTYDRSSGLVADGASVLTAAEMTGTMSMLRWEAIENPVTYAAQF